MATAVFIPPSPHDPLSRMAPSSRRAPLANISNATNSPHRMLTNSGSKRTRATANLNQQENEPPLKRQALVGKDAQPTTPRRRPQPTPAEGKEFERGAGDGAMNSFQKRLVAARDRNPPVKQAKSVEQNAKEVENIRQWQKHYRKAFPTFYFYFDAVPDEQRARHVRQLHHFDSNEEKFFSKKVTHIITTRPIPPEIPTPKSPGSNVSTEAMTMDEQSQTINPSLLDRNANAQSFQSASNPRRIVQMDILARGRQMGMKIWAAEKLQRVMATMLDDPVAHAHHIRARDAAQVKNKEDLSQVLRNEKISATTDREQISMPREIVPFRGPFIYVHDMDEKVRPTMIREYPRPVNRKDGEWPQFRSAAAGKCPFVEDTSSRKEEQERSRQKNLHLQQQAERQRMTRARASTAVEETKMEPPRRSPRKALQDVRNPAGPPPALRNIPAPEACKLDRQSSFPSMPEQPPAFMRPSQMHLIREPAASGIQKSNVTSAIQSQMISSTAATGIKASTSKDVFELKRKAILERSHTASLSIGSIPSSHRMNDLAGALKNPRASAPQRAAKSKAQEKLGGIKEEQDAYIDDIAAERATHAALMKKKAIRRDPKPGYCENCRDKYDDFEEHIVCRKHRKFAMTQSNWEELDALLRKLQAP